MKKCVLIVLCLFSLILCMGQVDAKHPINMQVKLGWKGEYKGDFIPAKVFIASSTPVNGLLRLKTINEFRVSGALLPVKKINIPFGTTKEFLLLIPRHILGQADCEILLERENKIKAKQIIPKRKDWDNQFIVGVISDHDTTLSFVHQL